MYSLEYSKKAVQDIQKLKAAKLAAKAKRLIDILEQNPFQYPPEYEKLAGKLQGKYSRRINDQHRLVYEVDQARQTVFILSLWSHYEF